MMCGEAASDKRRDWIACSDNTTGYYITHMRYQGTREQTSGKFEGVKSQARRIEDENLAISTRILTTPHSVHGSEYYRESR